MLFTLQQLSLDDGLRRQAADLMAAANLPSFAPWTPEVSHDDLGAIDSPMARFCDGKFVVRAHGTEWTLDGIIQNKGIPVRWTATIDLHGNITAFARPDTKVERGPDPEPLMAALGCGRRAIGSVGPLAPLFPEDAAFDAHLSELGLNRLTTLLVRADRVHRLRIRFFVALQRDDPADADG